MSMIAALFNKSVYNYEDAFRAKDKTSKEMRAAILEWFGLYYGGGTSKDEDPCQQIPYTIVRKLTKATFGEYKASGEDEFVLGVLAGLDESRIRAV